MDSGAPVGRHRWASLRDLQLVGMYEVEQRNSGAPAGRNDWLGDSGAPAVGLTWGGARRDTGAPTGGYISHGSGH